MAGNQYITNRKALFDENDEDVDDETFLKNSRGGCSRKIDFLGYLYILRFWTLGM